MSTGTKGERFGELGVGVLTLLLVVVGALMLSRKIGALPIFAALVHGCLSPSLAAMSTLAR